MFNIFVQTLGYLGVLSFITSYAQKSRKNIVFFSFLARAFFVTHYIFLGGYAGAIQNAGGGVAAALSGLRGKKPYDSPLMPVFIVVITAVCGFVTYDKSAGVLSLLPAVAMLIQNPALWLKNQRNIRLLTLAGIPIWFIYNFSMGSIPAMVSDTLSASSLIYSLVRYDFLPYFRKANNKEASRK